MSLGISPDVSKSVAVYPFCSLHITSHIVRNLEPCSGICNSGILKACCNEAFDQADHHELARLDEDLVVFCDQKRPSIRSTFKKPDFLPVAALLATTETAATAEMLA